MTYKPTETDFELSPYTGMTRKSWTEAGKYLLKGVFENIPSFSSPVVLPRRETEITYPHKNAEGARLKLEKRAEMFEGLARTLFIAAPIIHEEPGVEICGFSLREYYSAQILRACTRGDENFVGHYEDLQELSGNKDPFAAFQQTVETCALVICLDVCREEIWDRYGKAEKDVIADFLLSYAHSGTVPQNWRLFNMLDMAFLFKEGYYIDRNVMREHAQAILGYYAGDGWYRDGHSFDYYSCWAFNVYAPIWNNWYGYENEPYIAARLEENSNRLMETYPDMFDKDGYTMMWGRSCVYRNAATSPLAENLTLRSSAADPGLARRIASGSLLQFLTRDDFLCGGIPSMGFYRQFKPLIQGYSCTESAYWLGKAFLCLALPEDHPFWTARENNGSWEGLGEREIKETSLDGPALCFTNHGANGETILRTGKVIKNVGDDHGMQNYSKLAYNSKYPWEAAPAKNIEAMQYVLTEEGGEPQKCNVTLWHGRRGGVLYRRQFFDYSPSREAHWLHALNLADFPVEYGIIRADKLRLFRTPVKLTLGAYGFPDNGTEITEKSLGGAKAVILKGYDGMKREKQLAMTVYDGWDAVGFVRSFDTNPDSERSVVVYAETERRIQYGCEQFMLISQVITKESLEDFTEEELFPIKSVIYTDGENRGSFGPVTLILKNGIERTVDFDGIEGRLQI
ncbi:MAG: DUF2264 domain-containing protein [Bacteroides sp.]|nr:DUF2264 domain-containing protein [Bacteroides sp.]